MAHYRLTAKGTLPGEQFNFGMHATGAAGDAAGAAAALAAALNAFWTDATDGANTLYSNDVSILAAHAAELSDLTSKQVDAAEVSVSLTGTNAGDMLPHEVAWAVTTRAATANRKDRGRFYLPPPAVGEITNGLFANAACTRLSAACAILVNSLQGAGFNPVILHPDHTDTAITIVDPGNVPDVQRRRRNKLVEARFPTGV